MDFNIKLTKVKGHNVNYIVVNIFFKYVVFILAWIDGVASEVARLFVISMMKMRGLPQHIISD